MQNIRQRQLQKVFKHLRIHPDKKNGAIQNK